MDRDIQVVLTSPEVALMLALTQPAALDAS